MRSLRIDLQAGFDEDRVVVLIQGEEVYARNDVSTDYSAGLADSFETQAPDDAANVILRLPDRGLSAQVTVPNDRSHVGFSVEPDGRITHRLSAEAFRYM